MQSTARTTEQAYEQSMRRVLERAPSMLAYWSCDLRCRFANKAYERWIGVDAQGLVGTLLQDLLGPALFALNEPHIRAALRGEEQRFERTVPGPDGVQRVSLAHYLPDIVDGEVQGFVAEVTDVTSLTEIEAALRAEAAECQRVGVLLRKSEATLRQAQRLGQIGSWHWEAGSDITTWSDELYRIFGRDPSRLPPPFAENGGLYTAQSWSVLQPAVARTLECGKPYLLELEYVRPDGANGWVETRGAAERDGHGAIVGLHGTAQEITARRDARDARRELATSELFRERLEALTPGVVYVFDLERQCSVYISHSVTTALGYSPEEVGAMGADVVPTLMHPQDRLRFREHLGRMRIARDNDTGDFEFRMRNRAGDWRWVQSRDAIFSRNERGEVRELIGTAMQIEGRMQTTQALRLEIDERKQVQSELERVNSSLDRLLHTAPIGFCLLDLDLRYVRINERLAQINGIPAEKHLGRHVSEIIPTMAAEVRDVAARILATDQALLNVEFGGETPAAPGVRRFWDASWYPVRGNAGEVEGFGVIVDEITARKEAERALRDSEHRMRLATEASATGMWDWDVQTNVVTWSSEAYVIHGMREGEFDGSAAAFDQLIHPDDRDRLWAAVRAGVDRRERYACEFRITRPDGTVRWVTNLGRAVYDEQHRPLRMIGTITDVTDRKRAEQTLRESDERFRAAIAVISDVIWTNTADGLMQGEQRGWSDFTGQSAEEYQGFGWSKAVHPDDAQATLDAWTQAVHRKGLYVSEHRVRRRDGQWRVCSARAVPLLNADGTIREWVGVHIDITERRRDEEQLRQLADDLSEADRRKDEFLATLAHELRNPLAPIRNSLELMRRAHGNAGLLDRARATMERQVAQMVRLIDELLDVSRITRDKLTLTRERTELATVVHHAVETCQPHCDLAAQTLRVALPPVPIHLLADPVRLAQVFGNLLNNASKYTPAGGSIELAAEVHGDDVVVTVRDTGIGIPADMLARVFDLFTQVDASRNLSHGGLGIGLALAKRLTEMHGGSIAVRSEGRGRGSAFAVHLPVLKDDSDPAPTAAPASATMPVAARRILVVDDNRDSAESLAALLALDGHATVMAFDGLDALDKAASFQPDVILLDIGLPGLDGYETCRRIRQQPGGGNILIVAQTGWGQETDRRAAAAAGFDAHLLKPLDVSKLFGLLGAPRPG